MRTRLYLLAILFLIPSFVFSNPVVSKKSPCNAVYLMAVTLDTKEKTISGKMNLNWRNISTDTIHELQFHLYMNAFKNNRTTFMSERGSRFVDFDFKDMKEIDWGWCEIKSMKTKKGIDLMSRAKFISPDDGNVDDQTVLSVSLPDSIKPNEVIDLEIEFTTKLPKFFARTGYVDDYYFAGQWFPKIAVYESVGQRGSKKGHWNCHQFHANSEFFADFGSFDVKITAPTQFKIGTSGVLVSENKNADGTTMHEYKIDDILDFAWAASPHFRIKETQWKNVKITAYVQPQHYNQVDRFLSSTVYALTYFTDNLGEYPYSIVNIIDPAYKGDASSGMEYTTLFTTMTTWGMPKGVRMPEYVTVHEFGHAYFMGLLATNEFEEAFLDEGFNSYYESRIMDQTYGSAGSMIDKLGIQMGDVDQQRANYVYSDMAKFVNLNRFAWEFKYGGYGLTYSKTATWLSTLERLIGKSNVDEIFQKYYARWRFKHPGLRDFIAIANEVYKENNCTKLGVDLNNFFDQMFNSNETCDYAVRTIENNDDDQNLGFFDVAKTKTFIGSKDKDKSDKKNYKSKVVLQRNGAIILPVEVLVHFENGDEVTENWNGKELFCEFNYKKSDKIEWVKIDPKNKLLVDTNILNNSMTKEPETKALWKYFFRFLFWLQNLMQIFATIA